MDIRGGFYPNPNGSPITPATTFTGPLVAGTVFNSDGTGRLAGLGETSGTANAGYAVMAQTQGGISLAAAATVVSNIVIPAQSQILSIHMMTTTAGTEGETVSAGISAGGTAVLGAGADTSVLGQVALLPTTAPEIALWDNVGNTDIQVTLTPSAAGAGTVTLTVTYIQGINNVS